MNWSTRMADSIMARHPEINTPWNYEWGLALKAIFAVWQKTQDERYFDYVKMNLDRYVQSDGSILTYRLDEYNLDLINPGKVLFPLYRITGDERYKKAALLLRDQLRTHPRTAEGGFWHKSIYPHQMWLDGIYMACPFLAEFAATFADPTSWDEVLRQITLIDAHTGDTQTGLCYHGWDSSKTQRWADPVTGCSPHFWARAMGWYLMALVDILDDLDDSRRDRIVSVLQHRAAAVAAVQDAASGVWYQILDQGDRPGNYLESSASSMFVYALAKGIRQGTLDTRVYADVVEKAAAGLIKTFVTVDDDGLVNLNQMCHVAGLGAYRDNPYRDGSFAYYVSEPIVANDFKGVGPFILACLEIEAF